MTKYTKETLYRVVALSSLACFFWFGLACGSDEPEASNAPDYEATVAAALAQASASEQPTATVVPTPTSTAAAPTPTPTEVPPTPAPTVLATTTPDEPVASGGEPLAPLAMHDADAFLSDVSEEERSCLSGKLGAGRLEAVLAAPELADEADRSALLGCLEHDTSLRLLLTPVLSATGPISSESSACLRRSYADQDLNALMARLIAGSEPGTASEADEVAGMVAFVVSLSCLSEEEFQVAAPAMDIAPGEYETFQCVLDRVGGQDALTVLLTPAAEFPAALFEAAVECQSQLAGPPAG
jgi:hypothetical protein